MATAISIDSISKVYRLGTISSSTVGEDLNRWWARVRGRPDPSLPVGAQHSRPVGKQFWALDDVSFSVQQGDVLGVIGRNGAGKSTLLKILSQVTAPTSGQVTIHGRVASLLEVGTGFHPDLTGRENVFLNGAILGMTKAEIQRNFDQIVAFSECEAFIDTPVKRYSSGMYVRLAFAVAAHLESEVLIVDEVLAVGDTQFQKKCLDKMRDVSTTGRTVLFVSHSMPSIAALCNRAVLLKAGSVEVVGDTDGDLRTYRQDRSYALGAPIDLASSPRTGTGHARFTGLRIEALDHAGRSIDTLVTGSTIDVHVEIGCIEDIADANVALIVLDGGGYRVIDVNTALQGRTVSLRRGQCATVTFRLQDVLLRPGPYNVSLWVGHGHHAVDYVENACLWEFSTPPSASPLAYVYPGVYQCRFEHDVAVHG
jgi:lipopolysaccharide transport system ATP-binding protein